MCNCVAQRGERFDSDIMPWVDSDTLEIAEQCELGACVR